MIDYKSVTKFVLDTESGLHTLKWYSGPDCILVSSGLSPLPFPFSPDSIGHLRFTMPNAEIVDRRAH